MDNKIIDPSFEDFETGDTMEMAVPAAIHDTSDDDDEGPTGIFEIQPLYNGVRHGRRAAEGDHGAPAQDAGR